MPTPDLTEFLRARLAEDEAAAKSADVKQGDPQWKVSPVLAAPGRYTVRSSESNRPIARVEDVGDDNGELDGGPASILDGEAVSIHIARWDPARVLAEVAAKRALLELHEHIPSWDAAQAAGDDGDPGFGCRTCHSQDGEVQSCGWCPTILALAQVDAEHPDFHPNWRLRAAGERGRPGATPTLVDAHH